jgi:hypothetical protein
MRFGNLAPLACAIASALVLAAPVGAQTTASSPMAIKDLDAVMKVVEVTALVTAVDQKNRILTLKGPAGNEFSVLVDPAVKNLPQVNVGDVLAMKYYESVALDFRKGDGIRMQTVIDTSETAKKGQKPGAGAFTRINTVANIWAVDQAKGTVLVRGPYGHFAEVRLKDPKLLDGVKVGDQMQVVYTQAVAIGFVKVKS